jgi:precorrin-6A synthase
MTGDAPPGARAGRPAWWWACGRSEVADEIIRDRAAARERHGWIMDTCLLRRPDAG